MGVIIPKLRQSAKGQPCTFRTSYCNGDCSTTVLCHLPSIVKGLATKSDDWHAAFGCSACHEVIDQRRLPPEAELFYMLRALQLTQKMWVAMGLMTLAGDNPKPKPSSSKILPRKPLTVQP